MFEPDARFEKIRNPRNAHDLQTHSHHHRSLDLYYTLRLLFYVGLILIRFFGRLFLFELLLPDVVTSLGVDIFEDEVEYILVPGCRMTLDALFDVLLEN